MDRTQCLQVNETIHRHRLRDQSQRNEQDELYGLVPKSLQISKKYVSLCHDREIAERLR